MTVNRLVPPVKTQGRKTKLVGWLSSNIEWFGGGRWIEPFMGSCQVGLAFVPPDGALMCDDNPHLVNFCKSVQDGTVSLESVKDFFIMEGRDLRRYGEEHYFDVRDRFNRTHDPHDLLFLNHACFNGLMRWNSSGDFNSSYGHNSRKLNGSLIKSVCRRTRLFHLNTRDWEFKCQGWRKTVQSAGPGDFVYMDPPYEGLDVTYFSKWPDGETKALYEAAVDLPCGWALSTWGSSGEKLNDNMDMFSAAGCRVIEKHSRHVVGGNEANRVDVTECLIIPPLNANRGIRVNETDASALSDAGREP